jgi:hypothetical protein
MRDQCRAKQANSATHNAENTPANGEQAPAS